MPQLDQFDTFLGQIFWLLLTFGILYLLMSRFLIPRMVSILEARVFQIESDRRRAEEARMEADEFGGRLAYMVSTAQINGDRLRTDAVVEEREKTEKRLADLEQEIEARIVSSEERLVAQHAIYLKEAENSVVEIVDKVLVKILGSECDIARADLRKYVRDAIATQPPRMRSSVALGNSTSASGGQG